jgi:hypothetical protein
MAQFKFFYSSLSPHSNKVFRVSVESEGHIDLIHELAESHQVSNNSILWICSEPTLKPDCTVIPSKEEGHEILSIVFLVAGNKTLDSVQCRNAFSFCLDENAMSPGVL